MTRNIARILAVGALALLACHHHPRQQRGDVDVGVTFAAHSTGGGPATDPALVQSVVVNVTGVGMPAGGANYFLEKQPSGDWTGLIRNLPAAVALTFKATAWSAPAGTGTLLYASAPETVTLEPNRTSSLRLFLNEVNPNPYQNAAPIIQALFASADTVKPGAVIDFQATAIDPDRDGMTFAWYAPGAPTPTKTTNHPGPNLSSITDAFTWTMPGAPGVYQVRVVVTDEHGAQTVGSFDVTVTTDLDTADVVVTITVNDAPRVDLLTLRPTDPASTQFALHVVPSDTDSTSFSFAWMTIATPARSFGGSPLYPATPACAGSFAGGATADPTWTTTEPDGTACTVQVTVGDGAGGTNVGTVTFLVGRAPVTQPPTTTFVSSNMTVAAPAVGDPVTFTVQLATTLDVQLSWSTNFNGDSRVQDVTGAPGVFSDSFTTTMACAAAPGLSVITVNATSGALTKTYTFELLLPGCP